MRNIFLILIGSINLLLASDFEEGLFEICDETNQRWADFKSELAWHLEKTKPSLDRYHGEDKEENQYFFDKDMTSYKFFVEAVSELQEEFRKFRNKMGKITSLMIDGKCAYVTQASTSLDVTKWYTSYLEEHLFDKGWEEEYKKCCDLQRSP